VAGLQTIQVDRRGFPAFFIRSGKYVGAGSGEVILNAPPVEHYWTFAVPGFTSIMAPPVARATPLAIRGLPWPCRSNYSRLFATSSR